MAQSQHKELLASIHQNFYGTPCILPPGAELWRPDSFPAGDYMTTTHITFAAALAIVSSTCDRILRYGAAAHHSINHPRLRSAVPGRTQQP